MSTLAAALACGVVVTAARSSYLRTLSRRDLLLLGVCLALALALRLAARTFVASTSVESAQALGFMSAHRWGAGLSAVLRFIGLFTHVDVAAIARVNVFFSLATIVALFVLVDSYFQDRFAAFAAAAVLALQPISARYANSDSSAVLQALCFIAGTAFLVRWGRVGGRSLLMQGFGWLGFAANVRYESVVYMVAGVLLIVGTGRWPRRGAATRDVVIGGLFGSLFLLYPVARALGDASRGVFEATPLGYSGIFVLSPHSPRVVIAVALLGVVAAVYGRFRAAVSLLLALVVISVPVKYWVTACSEFPHRFAQAHLALWAAFAGYGFAAARRTVLRLMARVRGVAAPPGEPATDLPPLAAVIVLLVAAAAVVPHRGYLRRMWTYALEYEFVVANLRAIPDGCLIVGPDPGWEARGLRSSWHLSAEAGRRHRWIRIDDPALATAAAANCSVYYRSTTCFAYEGILEPQRPEWTGAERPICRRVAELFDLEPIATTELPSSPYMCEAHTVVPVPAGFYRIRPKPAASRAPAAGSGGGSP